MSRLSDALDAGYDPAVDGHWECAGCGRDITAGSWCAKCMAAAYPERGREDASA